MRWTFVAIFSFVFVLQVFAQGADSVTNRASPEREIALITGLGYNKSIFLVLGVAVNRYSRTGSHAFAAGYFISNEFHFTLDKSLVIAPKVGAWIGGGAAGMCMGLNLLDYIDFDTNALVLRPEIGIGPGKFRVHYGYNAILTNRETGLTPKHVFALTLYMVTLKKLY